MAFDVWGGYIAYGIGYVLTAAFLIAYRRDIVGRMAHKLPKEDYKHTAEAA